MSTQTIQPREENTYTIKRSYPLYKMTRLHHTTLDRIKARAHKYAQSVDEITVEILDKLDEFEKRGYETKEGSF